MPYKFNQFKFNNGINRENKHLRARVHSLRSAGIEVLVCWEISLWLWYLTAGLSVSYLNFFFHYEHQGEDAFPHTVYRWWVKNDNNGAAIRAPAIRWCHRHLSEKLREFELEALRAAAQKRRSAWKKECVPEFFSPGGCLLLRTLCPYWGQLKRTLALRKNHKVVTGPHLMFHGWYFCDQTLYIYPSCKGFVTELLYFLLVQYDSLIGSNEWNVYV